MDGSVNEAHKGVAGAPVGTRVCRCISPGSDWAPGACSRPRRCSARSSAQRSPDEPADCGRARCDFGWEPRAGVSRAQPRRRHLPRHRDLRRRGRVRVQAQLCLRRSSGLRHRVRLRRRLLRFTRHRHVSACRAAPATPAVNANAVCGHSGVCDVVGACRYVSKRAARGTTICDLYGWSSENEPQKPQNHDVVCPLPRGAKTPKICALCIVCGWSLHPTVQVDDLHDKRGHRGDLRRPWQLGRRFGQHAPRPAQLRAVPNFGPRSCFSIVDAPPDRYARNRLVNW
jgi:hypothetical protein